MWIDWISLVTNVFRFIYLRIRSLAVVINKELCGLGIEWAGKFFVMRHHSLFLRHYLIINDTSWVIMLHVYKHLWHFLPYKRWHIITESLIYIKFWFSCDGCHLTDSFVEGLEPMRACLDLKWHLIASSGHTVVVQLRDWTTSVGALWNCSCKDSWPESWQGHLCKKCYSFFTTANEWDW